MSANYFASLDARLIKNFVYDGNGNMTHLGMADPGTANGDAKWFIMEMTYSETVNANGDYDMLTQRVANGSNSQDQIWTGYATHTYS